MMSNFGIRFMVYHDTVKLLRKYNDNQVVCDMTAGAIAGVTQVYSNHWTDVIKTRMQSGSPDKYKGFIDCGQKIMME